MKESHKEHVGIFKSGLIKLAKIIWIIIKSFFEAITWDFYNNIKKYWKKYLKGKQIVAKEEPKPEPKEEPKEHPPLP
ncbi:MAG: hypothetical protein KKA79_08915 [Nanoarchaeota archaeon]|nr:hypothetical protein [Nanoarchaeota archaeon]